MVHEGPSGLTRGSTPATIFPMQRTSLKNLKKSKPADRAGEAASSL